MNQIKIILWKILALLISFVFVVIILVNFKFWQENWVTYFWRSERWLELIFVLAVAYIVSKILEKLLIWQVRLETMEPVKIKRRIKR